MKVLPLMLALVFLASALWWRGPSKVSERPILLWKHSLKQAEISRKEGDLYRASSFYAHAAHMAASVDDWEGLLAAACGLQRLGEVPGPGMNSHAVLMRAMVAAERKQNTEGLETVATAFKATGEWFASLALSRIQESRPGGRQMARELKRETCWPTAGGNEEHP